MQLIDQRTKAIMEECKERARGAGLRFHDETLEYIVTNRDLLELSPKNMIPTLYDYWVHDLQAFKEKRIYELYPHNPYETVINTRPAISFYNDNNPDWLNVMIFYHVIGHIDFFQNNALFRHTWNDDFNGLALADKRLIARLRSEKGKWVDYVIEFTRGIDNLVGYYEELADLHIPRLSRISEKADYYFDVFLSVVKKIKTAEYLKEIDRYNQTKRDYPDMHETIFFSEVEKKYPEFEAHYSRFRLEKKEETGGYRMDLIRYLMDHSPFINSRENLWMKSVMEIVRRTSLYFEPQKRTKIFNEGWSSYWHEKLFLTDPRIRGYEADFAAVNAKVMPMPRAGLNPYSLGWRLLLYIEELADRGRISFEYQRIRDSRKRQSYDKKTGSGREYLLSLRETLDDFLLISNFVDQDFVDRHQLFVLGRRLNAQRGVWEYYVKSRDAEKYRKMLFDSLYHPPHITVDKEKTGKEELYLVHNFEGKPLVREYIGNTMLGLEYLYGGTVMLETHESDGSRGQPRGDSPSPEEEEEPEYRRVLYTMQGRKLSKKLL